MGFFDGIFPGLFLRENSPKNPTPDPRVKGFRIGISKISTQMARIARIAKIDFQSQLLQ